MLSQGQGRQKRRGPSQRMYGGADIVSESGQGERCRARAASDGLRAFHYYDGPSRFGEDDCGGEPVGSGTDDYRVIRVT